MKIRGIRSVMVLFLFTALLPGTFARADEKKKEAPGLTKEIAELFASTGDLAGEPAMEAGALMELLTQLEKSTAPQTKTLREKILHRLVLLSQQEVLSALAAEQPVPAPFGEAFETAWDKRGSMPEYFGRMIIESILNLAPRSRSAQSLLEEFESYDESMGLPRIEFYTRWRKAQLELITQTSDWKTSAETETDLNSDVGDDDLLSDVIDSIYCAKPKTPGAKDEDSEEEKEDPQYPRIWKDSDARDLIEKLGQRLLDLKFSTTPRAECKQTSCSMYWWSSLMNTLAEKAEECKSPAWQAKLKAKEAEVDAILKEIDDGKGTVEPLPDPVEPSMLNPDDEAREILYEESFKALNTDKLSLPDAWTYFAGITDPLVRVRILDPMLASRFTTAENIDEVLKSAFELGGVLKDTSTEGYLYFLWKMLANESLAKFKRDAHVRKQIAPLLVQALNSIPSGWRAYLTFAEADGDWTQSSWFAQTQVRNRGVSLFIRGDLSTEDFAATWKQWEAKEPLEAKKAFAEIHDPSLRWVLRYEWFSKRVQDFETERDRKEWEAQVAEQKRKAEAEAAAKAKANGGKAPPAPEPASDGDDHP